MMSVLFGILGLIILIGIAWLFSSSKKNINWRIVLTGLGLQLVFAIFVILTPWGSVVFDAIGSFFVKIISFTFDGAAFVFGPLANQAVLEQAFPDGLKSKGV
jgi:CNT family concentrative nucleoside transporter